MAHVPVIDDRDRQVIGMVVAGVRDAGVLRGRAGLARSTCCATSAIALVIGVVGSLLLARRVKKQTLGLEPHEITALVEHREAMLHGIKEGVVGLDAQHRITLVNDHARDLLALPEDAVGRSVEELELNDRLRDVLTGAARPASTSSCCGTGVVLTHEPHADRRARVGRS